MNSTDISQNIAVRESDLRKFQTQIDTMSIHGVNVSAAVLKYNAALAAIQNAKSAPYESAMALLLNTSTLTEKRGEAA